MQTDPMLLYKLILLYILNKVDFPLTNAQLSNFILEKGYTDYFNIQQSINELLESKLITREKIRNRTQFVITEAGRQTISFFHSEISVSIREEIDNFLKENKYQLREEVSNVADFYQKDTNVYIARCFVKEGEQTIIELNLAVTSEEEAQNVCNNWQENSADIYAYLMQKLL